MKISIVTVTYNCEKEIASLISCIERLQGNEFEWVVIDGGSTDSTVALVRNARVAKLTVQSEPDFGIYDALNKAVRACKGEYYLVLGADDRIYDDTLQNFTNELNAGDCDFVAAAVKGGERILFPGSGGYWRRGGNAFVASHAVGTLIKTSLHAECGFYRNRYPNCADMYFILFSILKKHKTMRYASFVAGEFGCEGVSSVDRATSVTDAFRISRDLGDGFWLPALVLIYRLVRFCR